MKPRYPIYVPSKARAGQSQTVKLLDESNLDYYVVVEPQDADSYATTVDPAKILVLPQNDGGLYFARNFCVDHATTAGAKRHWQADDDLLSLFRVEVGRKVKRTAAEVMSAMEDVVDTYSNVALAGPGSSAWPVGKRRFVLNRQVFTCVLVSCDLPHRWRPDCIEDTDFSLQVLTAGYCSILFHEFLFRSPKTGTGSGGMNTPGNYVGDSRMRLIRGLQRRWPHLIGITHTRGLPKANTAHLWRKFDQPLLEAK